MPKTKTKSRKRKSQVAKVYNWLTNGNSINPRTAISRFNIYRLAAVEFLQVRYLPWLLKWAVVLE